jgi:hypothetical protein
MRSEQEIRERVRRLEAWQTQVAASRPSGQGYPEIAFEVAELRWVLGEMEEEGFALALVERDDTLGQGG